MYNIVKWEVGVADHGLWMTWNVNIFAVKLWLLKFLWETEKSWKIPIWIARLHIRFWTKGFHYANAKNLLHVLRSLYISENITHKYFRNPLVGVPVYFPAFVFFVVGEGGDYAVNAMCVYSAFHICIALPKKELTIRAVICNPCARLQHQYMLWYVKYLILGTFPLYNL
jgi:hypothetical protein